MYDPVAHLRSVNTDVKIEAGATLPEGVGALWRGTTLHLGEHLNRGTARALIAREAAAIDGAEDPDVTAARKLISLESLVVALRTALNSGLIDQIGAAVDADGSAVRDRLNSLTTFELARMKDISDAMSASRHITDAEAV